MEIPGPILFLDFDGVLTNDPWERIHESFTFDPANVRHVNRIVEATGARIVISSDWRRLCFDRVCNRLASAGLEHRPIGCTPPEEPGSRITRGMEIDAWLARNHYRGVFAILDDSSEHLLKPHADRFVRVDAEFGLTAEDADRAIALLAPRP
jgi:hypothetical protein